MHTTPMSNFNSFKFESRILDALLMKWLIPSLCLCIAIDASAQGSWAKELPGIGTFSSPRVADLNRDGVDDIVLGAGKAEFEKSDSAVVALDGKTGELLWHISAKDQIFGSAIFLDITGDSIVDAFIGGRSAEYMAINGATGEEIWRFNRVNRKRIRKERKWFNFYNGQLIPDQDNDGLKDLLIANGGDVTVEAYDPNRPPGSLVILSSKSGIVLAKAQMPDKKEIYHSITVSKSTQSEGFEVLFGTGGETIGGRYYVCSLDEVIQEDLSNAILLDTSERKGYIGPSARVDINLDGIHDIITNSVDGRLIAFDGASFERLWEVAFPSTECYSSVAIGYFNQDDVPDFFISYARGVWPKLNWSLQNLIDGKDGSILFTDSMGFYQNTTPVVLDIDNDGLDEVLLSVNFQEVNTFYQKFFYTMLVQIDFQSGQMEKVSEVYEGSNLSSTPWVGDLDQDGFVDIVYCHGTNLRHTYTFDGMMVRRFSTKIPITKPIIWGAYQGSNYDGIFAGKQRLDE